MIGMREPWYKLMTYICRDGCARSSPFEPDAWASFTTIFTKRPDGCRYGIAMRVVSPGLEDPPRVRQEYVVWDFYDPRLVRGFPSSAVPTIEPVEVSRSYHALLMKVVMLYEQ